MKDGVKAKAVFAPQYVRASKDYVCDGCCGEYPIKKGDYIMVQKIMTHDGKFDVMRLCSRCKLAVQAKLAHSDSHMVEVTRGSLKFQCLSSAFKRGWAQMEKTLIEHRKNGPVTREMKQAAVEDLVRAVVGEEALDREKYEEGVKKAMQERQVNRRKLTTMRKAYDEQTKELAALKKRNIGSAMVILKLCDQIAANRMGLFLAKTDQDREDYKTKFLEALNAIRAEADRIAEKDKDASSYARDAQAR